MERAHSFLVVDDDLDVLKAAATVFHVNADVQPSGSGDTTWSYIQVAIAVVFAAVIGAVWALLVKRRSASERTFEILRTFLRFVLAVAMVNYGIYKVIQLQFPKPWLERLVQQPAGFVGRAVAANFCLLLEEEASSCAVGRAVLR